MIIVNTLVDDLGSFAVEKEYCITGAGVQDIHSPVNTINVVKIQQEKFRELIGDQVITIAEDYIRDDVNEFFDGPFAVYITNICLLSGNSENKEVFISCTATTVKQKTVDYRCYAINPNLDWTDSMEVITDQIYERLYADMRLKTDSMDLQSFGIVYHCFNPL